MTMMCLKHTRITELFAVIAEEFFPPDLKVEYLNKDRSITKKLLDVKDFFYHGYAISHNASGVALSLCNGKIICMAGSSVFSLDAPDPVTGGWSAWMDSPCSRTCGGGVIIHQRVCNNPFPSWGGAFHVREGVEFRLCNLEVR
ncbi:A disintegrin and metalloproteinase with thrombospondin motifs 12 [Holothuria leucospilota]|uniref:A disintegrin and metalloproteinase with thrombospondin motifs 12 n=1 Tax=Holothuria leucospilota TaxID=206669 RepID=A0A9Q1BE91_HOLLE|nr:A disintegrin and metalloproteinase with thrombospondin motifs 12 [Holothuria leucospilota]